MKWRPPKPKKLARPKHYRYVITLEQPCLPRKLADELSYCTGIFPYLVSITDGQNDTHVYGATYQRTR